MTLSSQSLAQALGVIPGPTGASEPAIGSAAAGSATGSGSASSGAAAGGADPGASGSTGAGSATGATGGAGAAGDEGINGLAGLGVDEIEVTELDTFEYDDFDGEDASRETDMAALPGNYLNMQDLVDLRERNQLRVREQALRAGDPRSVSLDHAGLEILQAAQREIEHQFFSQGAVHAPNAPTQPDTLIMDAGRDAIGPMVRPAEPRTSPEADGEAGDDRPRPAGASDDITFGEELPASARARIAAGTAAREIAELCTQLQAATLADLGLYEQAKTQRATMRDIEVEDASFATPAQNDANEERFDRALGFEMMMHARLEQSIARASTAALKLQKRRLALTNQLRPRMR